MHSTAGIWNVLTLGLSNSSTEEESKKSSPKSPIASQSILLLLVLSNHCTAERSLHNPYREALLHAQNFQGKNCIQFLVVSNGYK